jgi:uncharacterized protein (TIGR02271 family)
MTDRHDTWGTRRDRDDADDELVRLATVEGSGVEVVRSEERAEVGVERVARRRVRLVKRVVVEQQVIELRREELHVEELPVADLALTGEEPALAVGRREPLELVLSEEEVVVTRRVVPRERVRVFVDTVRESAEVAFALRHEEVDVQDVSGRERLRD